MARGFALLTTIGGMIGLAAPAMAQDMPMVDAVGAYTHSQVMRHDGDARPSKKRSAPSTASANANAEGMRRLMALSPDTRRELLALKPELDRRTRTDGAASANRWFEGKVAEAERREASRGRKR